jgi:hypothetical protein
MEGDDRDSNEAPSGFLSEISKFRKGGLKPTETVHSAGPQSLDTIIVPKANVRVFDDKTEYYDAPADFRQKVREAKLNYFLHIITSTDLWFILLTHVPS